jgi:hypothetical protein
MMPITGPKKFLAVLLTELNMSMIMKMNQTMSLLHLLLTPTHLCTRGHPAANEKKKYNRFNGVEFNIGRGIDDCWKNTKNHSPHCFPA